MKAVRLDNIKNRHLVRKLPACSAAAKCEALKTKRLLQPTAA